MARILVVDDEPDVAEMLQFILERDGHQVSLAGDGVAALAALGLDPVNDSLSVPDLAMLDVMMPKLDGYAVCAMMYKNPRTKLIPILMLTAKDGMQDLHSHTPNVAAHIKKPFEPRTLLDLVAGMMDEKK